MITPKYEKMYEKFIKFYEENHVNPWHEMTKNQLDYLYFLYINNNNVEDKYSYYYMMQYIIKRLSGKNDSHTSVSFSFNPKLPFIFRVIDNDIYVVGAQDKEALFTRLVSINGVDINKIVSEIEETISYGTKEWFEAILVQQLKNQEVLLSLPSLRDSISFNFKLVDENNNVMNREYSKYLNYSRKVTYNALIPKDHKNLYYETDGDTIIFTYNSCVNSQCERMKEVMNELDIKLSSHNYNRIIIDIRCNSGGNENNNKPIIDLLKKYDGLEIITLTGGLTFSSGRFMLMALKNLGTLVIGERPGTPINCYGNCVRMESKENKKRMNKGEEPIRPSILHTCSGKYWYFDQDYQFHGAKTKEEYEAMPNEWKVTDFMEPDIESKPTLEDYKNGRDPVIEYAIKEEYNKTNKER